MRSPGAPWPALLLALASCTVGPDYRAPSFGAGPPDGAPAKLIESHAASFSDDPPPGEWWRLYDNADLDALERKALAHNTDLRTAAATLEAARASLRATQLERTPGTLLSANVAAAQASADTIGAPSALPPGPLIDLTAAASYNLDLFGRIRRGVEAQSAGVGAAQAALDLARINVAASVADAYANVCATGNQILVARHSIALASDIVDATNRRFRGGVTGVNDVVRARALLVQTQAQMPDLVARQRAALYRLTTLTGDPPEAFPRAVSTCATPPVIRRPIPVGDGMSLLKRRPDIREAERRLAASVASIGIATSALYPDVAFGGQVGTIATRPQDVLQARGLTWSLGPALTWSFPNLSIAKAEIVQANAVAKANLASFDGAILTALRETETALVALDRQRETEQSLRDARDEAALAARNTERLYAGGVGAFIDTLDAERTLIQADASLAQATSDLADRQVQFFLALGGGWQDAPAPADTPLDQVAIDRHRPTPRAPAHP